MSVENLKIRWVYWDQFSEIKVTLQTWMMYAVSEWQAYALS